MADAQLKAVITAEDRASRVIAGVGKSLDDTKSRLAGALDFTKKLAPAFAVLGVTAGGLAIKGVQVAGQLEAMRQGFVTLLGSAEAADKTMARIKKEAARTPFELPGLTSATQALALVTKDGDKAIDILMNVGKALATAGKGQAELDRIIANLQQIALTGQITEMDIRQFGMSGVNILELLAKHYGTTTEKASEMVKNSKDAFGDLTAAFQEAGAEGGQFAKGFENQAGTFQVIWSNLMDTINVKLAELVTRTGVFDVVKTALSGITEIIPALVDGIVSAVNFFADLKNETEEVNRKFQEFKDRILETEQVKTAIDAIKTSFDGLWNSVKTQLFPAFQELWNTVKTQLYPAFQEFWTAIQPLTPYFEFAAKVIGGILLLALQGLVQIVVNVLNQITLVIAAITKLINLIAQGAAQNIKNFTGWINGVADSFKSVFDWITKAYNKLTEFLSKAGSVGKSLGGSIGSALGFRASGGQVSPNRSFIVGENGPELFSPSTYGSITSNNRLGVGGGITVNVYGDVSGSELVEKVKRGIMSEIKQNALV